MTRRLNLTPEAIRLIGSVKAIDVLLRSGEANQPATWRNWLREFEVELEAGSSRLQAWLTNTRGPYYVYAQRLTGCTDSTYVEFDPTAVENVPALCNTLNTGSQLIKTPEFLIHNNSLHLKIAGSYSISLLSLTGKTIAHFKGSGSNSHPLPESMQPGLYLIHIKANNFTHIRRYLHY